MIGLSFKLIIFIFVVIHDYLFEDYDTCLELLLDPSTQLTPIQSIIYTLLKGHTRWDSVFFMGIAKTGYLKEKNHAFFPGFPIILSSLAGLITDIIGDYTISLMVVGFALNTVFYFLNILLVYK